MPVRRLKFTRMRCGGWCQWRAQPDQFDLLRTQADVEAEAYALVRQVGWAMWIPASPPLPKGPWVEAVHHRLHQEDRETFFETLSASGATHLVDVRLNNVSQLAGFAKKQDLAYFLKRICGMDYLHLPILAPTQGLLDEYKKRGGDWSVYEEQFLRLMKERQIDQELSTEQIANGCLLCSEHEPSHCHRRLVAEYLRESWGDLQIEHLT